MKMAGKKNLALIELILVILFFALSAVVLVQVFVKAKSMSDTSRASTLGLVTAQDLVEQLKAAPEEADRILSEASGWAREEFYGRVGCTYTAGYGEDMRPVQGEAAYEVRAVVWPEFYEAGTLYRIEVTVERVLDQEKITELVTARYVSESREATP